MENDGGMTLTGESRRTRRKTCPSANLSTTNPTWIDPGANPGLPVGRPATNRLSHDTAIQNIVAPSYRTGGLTGPHLRSLTLYPNRSPWSPNCLHPLASCGVREGRAGLDVVYFIVMQAAHCVCVLYNPWIPKLISSACKEHAESYYFALNF
jgi:hypothetical protein